MIVVRNIRVFTLDRDSLTVTWNYENTTKDLSTYTVAVLRSGSEVGPYSQVSTEINANDTTTFDDTSVNLYSKNRDHYYRIRVTESGSGNQVEYGSTPAAEVIAGKNPRGVTLEAFPDLEAAEAVRRLDVLLQEYMGRKVLVLAQRSTGTRCTECWDALKRRRSKSNCLTCYGVGIEGGYYRPREAYAAKFPEAERNQLSSLFELQANDIAMVFSSRPRLHPRDLVIDSDGRRFRVLNVTGSGKLSALTRQTVSLRELSKDQPEYDINISGWDVDTFTASPKRQFIRATDIDSYHTAAQAYGIEDA